MSTASIDIVVSETGSRTVRRNLDDLGSSADQASSSLEALQAANRQSQSAIQQLQAEVAKLTAQQNALQGALSRSAKEAAAQAAAFAKVEDVLGGMVDAGRQEVQALGAGTQALDAKGQAALAAAASMGVTAETALQLVQGARDVGDTASAGAAFLRELGTAGKDATDGLSGVGEGGATAAAGLEEVGTAGKGASDGLAGMGSQGAAAAETLSLFPDEVGRATEQLSLFEAPLQRDQVQLEMFGKTALQMAPAVEAVGTATEAAGKSAHGATGNVSGLATGLRAMRQEGFLVGLLSRQMGELGIASGSTARLIGSVALGVGGMMGPLLALEGGISLVATLREQFEELHKAQEEAAKRAREFGTALEHAAMDGEATWQRFERGLTSGHLSDAQKLYTEQMAQLAEEIKKVEVAATAAGDALAKKMRPPSTVDTGQLIPELGQSVGELQAQGAAVAAYTRQSPDDLLKSMLPATTKLTEEGRKAAIAYITPIQEQLKTALQLRDSAGIQADMKQLGTEVAASYTKAIEAVVRGSALTAGLEGGARAESEAKQLEGERAVHAETMRFAGEELRVRQENADKLAALAADAPKYQERYWALAEATENAGSLAIQQIRQKHLEELHAMETRVAQVTASDRTKIALQAELEVERLENRRTLAKGDPAEQARLEGQIRLTRELATEQERLRDQDLDPATAAMRKLTNEEQDLNAAVKAGNLSAADRARLLDAATARSEDAIDPVGALARAYEREAQALRLVGNAREIETKAIAEEKRLREAGRPVSDPAALRAQIAAQVEMNRVAQAAESIYQQATGSQQQWNAGLTAADGLLAKGKISLEQYLLAVDNLRREADPAASLAKSMEDELRVAGRLGAEREIESRLIAHEAELRQKLDARALDPTYLRQKRAEIAAQIQQNALLEARYTIEQQLNGPRAAMAANEQATRDLVQSGRITPEQGFYQGVRNRSEAYGAGLPFDQNFSDGWIRQLGLVEEASRNFSGRVGEEFGALTTSVTEGFATATARGIAFGEDVGAALGDMARGALADLIAGLERMALQLLINKALGMSLGSLFGGGGSVPVAAAGLLTGPGASTPLAAGGLVVGPGGPTDDRILTPTSNGEYVVNAASTAANLALLEEINRSHGALAVGRQGYAAGGYVGELSRLTQSTVGRAPAPSAAQRPMVVELRNETNHPLELVQGEVTEDRVVVIARAVARDEVRRGAPASVASDLYDPNGATSTALRRTHKVEPRR